MFSWLAHIGHSPYRFLIAAAVLAAILCLFPVRVDAPEAPKESGHPERQAENAQPAERGGVPAGADLSERTDEHTTLHRTMTYAHCGHSVQRREKLPAALCGLSRGALETEIEEIIPGALVTGFSSAEVDIAVAMDMPCPLHWVVRPGEKGKLVVVQNVNGESLETVRETDVPNDRAAQEEMLPGGRIFDDVQALEGYLESLSS